MHGLKTCLKSTQAYPTAFGEAIAAIYMSESSVKPITPCFELDELDGACSDDPWDDAGLDSVLQDLLAMHASRAA